MSTTVQDYRRTDLRLDSGGDPFWIKSRVVDGFEIKGLKNKACILFSFPVVDQQFLIREIAFHVLRPFTSGTTLELGVYTLATDGVETSGVATAVNTSSLVDSADVVATTVGWYYPQRSGFVDARKAGIATVIVGAAVNVPAICITPKVATIVTGQVQVLMLVCVVPA
jgi:hypothetical protein